jgi:hypothetical protein
MGANPSSDHVSVGDDRHIVFDRTIDWVIGALLGVVGILVALGGAALHYGVTRSGVADVIRDAEFQSEMLTRAEAIDALVVLGHWSGIGFVAAGGLIALLGIAVVVIHGRARRDGRGTPPWIVGVVGAGVASVLGFIPFSPVLGGAAAGYLDPNPDASGIGVGSIAGVFGSLPLLVPAIFASIGLFVSVPGEVVLAAAIILVFVVILCLVYYVGLSALGGYLGGWIRDH